MSLNKTLVDYEDLYLAVLEELKIPSTDGTTLGRIKRDINMIYLNHVVPFKPRAWFWLEKKEDIVTYAKVTTGTVTVTVDSASITFSSAPSVSLAGYYFKLAGAPEIIKISAHTAASTSATLETAWPDSASDGSGLSFKAWKDYAELTTTMKQVTQVTHDRMSRPLDLVANVIFDERRARYAELEGYPTIICDGDFSTDLASTQKRVVRWYPACSDKKYILHVTGVQEATPLSADADEPLMPVEDRIVIFYGAASRAWARERNETEATKNWNLFTMKLNEMAAKGGEAPQITQMSVDPDYLVRKRYRRLLKRGYGQSWNSSD